jgi:adenylosuccinate lyase
MIERYALSPIKDIWGLKQQYERWLEVELAVIEAFEDFNQAPKGTSEKIRKKASIDVEKILEIEKVVDHDVIAFIKGVTDEMGDEARYFHKGLTSSDIVDTSWALAMKRAGEIIIHEYEKFIDVLKEKALMYKNTITVGRTHGIHAEPTSFGLKLLSFLAESERNMERLKKSIYQVSQGKLSGAVGNYANISPEVEKVALEKLGLRATKVSTQIVPRDIHAEFLNALSFLGSGLERLATEIRHLQKTEVLEVQEPFKKGQRGSSAMPHKKNPIICERITGMARMLRSYTITGYENIVLWHERDISHSSAERVFIPDACMTAYYITNKAIYLIKNLVVNEDRMLETFERSYNLVYSQRVLLGLIEKGMSRENAYKLVQKNALYAWENRKDFKQVIKEESEINTKMNSDEINELFSNNYFLRNIEEIYKRFDF